MTTRPNRRRRAALVAAALVAGAGTVAAASPVDAQQAPTPAQCNNRVNNTAKRLLDCVNVQGVRQHLATLQRIADANGGTRAAGTPGYTSSVQYAVRIFKNAGYDVTVQPFDFLYTVDESTLIDDAGNEYDATVNAFVPAGGLGTATGPLVAVDVTIPPTTEPSSDSGCEPEDFIGFQAGSVALVQRGTCDFVVKARNAQAAGAIGVVIFNEGQPGRDGEFSGIGDGTGITIPVVFSDFASGEALYAATQAGPVTVTVDAARFEETRTIDNVIAETTTGNDNEVVMVGAHLDSVQAGPGINDNGSGGAAAILEVAENMRNVHPTNTVRFALWGAEEEGLLGSDHYVASLDEEQSRDIALYLNFDMIGSPNYVRAIYDGNGDAADDAIPGPPGSDAIESLFEQFYADRNLASQPTAFDGRSDYGPFIAVGIPSGGLFTGAEDVKTPEEAAIYGGTAGEPYDGCYHAACDTFANINNEVLDVNADAVALATLTYSKSTKSLGVGDAQRAQAQAQAKVAAPAIPNLVGIDQSVEHAAS